VRILQLHSDFIEYEPIKKEITQAEDVEKKKYKIEEVVVLFTAVEQGDNEATGKNAIDEVKKFLENLKVNKILIYPYAHLSSSLAKPSEALTIVKEMEAHAKKLKIETFRAPFGWTKAFSLKIKGHPLAEQSKEFRAEAVKEKKISEGKIKRLGKKPAIETEKLSEKDHRVIGQKLDLYSFQEVAPGMVFLHNKGMLIRNLLYDFWRKEHIKRGYQEIYTPQILNKNIWLISGHWDHYKDSMFFTKVDDVDFGLRPMNCPGAIMVYKSTSRSYRDLPLRLAEFGLVHRNELSGVLSGLFRVRAFTQDDAHIFVTPERLEDEIINVVDLIDFFYKIFGFEYHIELSTRPENAMGSKEMWNKAEKALKEALNRKKSKFKLNPGEGAFYGPKIDFHIKDSLGRAWQCATVQVDFPMPENFDLSYIADDGKNHRPILIHRVIFGSVERFIGILVEHYGGAFPVWLSPVQVRVLPISEDNKKYAEKIKDELIKNEIRTEIDLQNNTIEYKIRGAQLQKIPYMLVVGDKEEKSKTVAVRSRDGKVKYKIKVDDFIKQVLDESKRKVF
jgi:threonyl-tRNA synthetase